MVGSEHMCFFECPWVMLWWWSRDSIEKQLHLVLLSINPRQCREYGSLKWWESITSAKATTEMDWDSFSQVKESQVWRSVTCLLRTATFLSVAIISLFCCRPCCLNIFHMWTRSQRHPGLSASSFTIKYSPAPYTELTWISPASSSLLSKGHFIARKKRHS